MTRLAALLLLAAVPASALTIAQARDKVVEGTMKYLGVPYLWGGTHPDTGLDCSSFVQAVYRDAGLKVPRVSREQFGSAKRVPVTEVLPADLIFFSMKRPGGSRVDHVGIYVGKGYFVHASYTQGVRIEHIAKAYYRDRLVSVLKYPGF